MPFANNDIKSAATYQIGVERRKAAEESLRVSEGWRRRILNAPPAHICVIDARGVIVGVNDEWTRFAAANDATGSPAVAVGANYLEVCRRAAAASDQDAAQALDGIRGVLAGSAPKFSMEYPCHAPHEQRWFLMMATPFGADGFRGVIIAHIGITWRGRAEQTQRLLADLTAASPAAITIHDTEGHFFYANEKTLKLHGYTPEEFLALSIGDVDVPASAHRIQERIAKLRAEGAATFEVEHRRKDGSVFPLLVNARLTTWEGREAIMSVATDITERKQAVEALLNSEARYRMLHESLRDAYVQVAMDGRVVDFNDHYCDMLGYSPSELRELTYIDLTPAQWHAAEAQIVREQIIPRGYSDVYQKEYRRKDGTVIPVEFRTILLRDDDGSAFGMWATVRDITNRKRIEEALKHERDLLQSIMNGSGNSHLVYLDCNFNFILVNETYARTCGYAPEEMIGKNHFALYPHEENEAIFKRVRDTGEPFQINDKPFVFPDQSERGVTYWDWTLTPVKNGAGQVNGLILSLSDTTERVRAEKALKESEERFRALVEPFAQAVWEADAAGRVLSDSPSWCACTGQTLDDLLGERWLKAVHPDDQAYALRQWKEATLSGASLNAEFRLKSSDGTWNWTNVRAAPLRGADGRVFKWVGMNVDVTQRKTAEEALVQLNESLEEKVRERTVLAETRAKQLQALAVELIETEERERRQFAHLLHEDLQQMLAAAKLQVTAAAATAFNEPMLSGVASILGEAIAKSRQLSHELSPPILHQAGLISALKWLSRQVRENFGLEIELELNANLLLERTHQKVFLFRAVQELLFNIVKHAGTKCAKVAVSSTEDAITVTISDQGRGFDPQAIQECTGKLRFGLLTIKERVSYIGGKFTIESTPGRGSRFTLTVPNAAAIGHEETCNDASVTEELESQRSMGIKPAMVGTRVLFVDDHQVMRQGLIKLVKGQPEIHIAGEAANGREAIEQARKLKPDVVVMDISMPVMDGLEATRRIKAELPNVRVIGLSMHDDPQLTASMKQAGAEATLSKTTSAAELIKAIYGGH